MNNNSNTTNSGDQEIDLSQISKKIGTITQSFFDKIFDGIIFFKKNIIIISILFIIGAGLGYYMDKSKKIYDHQMIVIPNFESVDYLYSKVGLVDSKIREQDILFLKGLGIKDPKKLLKIEIEPIIDVYRFVENNEQNFQMIKLMADNGDIKKILESNVTSKNYKYHLVSFTTVDSISKNEIIKPLLDLFNSSDYFKKVQKERVENLVLKIKSNEETIGQINGILNQFSGTFGANQKNDKLIYYNENTQLNEVIKTKEQLVQEMGYLKVQLQNYSNIVKESSSVMNIRNTKLINGKMKLVLPVLFIGLFMASGMFIAFYKRQMKKRNLA